MDSMTLSIFVTEVMEIRDIIVAISATVWVSRQKDIERLLTNIPHFLNVWSIGYPRGPTYETTVSTNNDAALYPYSSFLLSK